MKSQIKNRESHSVKNFANVLALFIAFISFGVIFTACKEDDKLIPPKWELPQPMDTLLFGSWELIKDGMLDVTDHYPLVTFYNDNKYITKFSNNVEYECRWSVRGDTLVLPDGYDIRTNRFAEYTYSFSDDRKILYVNLIHYPFVGKGPFTLEPTPSPLGPNNGTFKRLEDE